MATSAEPLEGLHCTKSTTCNSPHTCLCQSQKHFTTKSIYKLAKFYLAWENSHNFATGGGGWGGEELLTTGFPRKWHLRNDCRNSILIMHLGSASDWLCCLGIFLQPVRSATQICTVFSMEFLRSSFRRPPPPSELSFLFLFPHCAAQFNWCSDFNFLSSGYNHWAIFWLLFATNCICWWSSKICHS